ncbi:MAG: hypothetical protein NT179_02235 [Nitrospirae bacterium]|nr:hypothetical protein [Nitrospirota bacterium]
MSEFQPEKFSYEQSATQTTSEKDTVVEKRRKVTFDTEDIIAGAAASVAILFTLAMIAGKLPVNELTIGVVAFSGAGAAIAKIIKMRRR